LAAGLIDGAIVLDEPLADESPDHETDLDNSSESQIPESNYQPLEVQPRQRLGEEADRPHRIQYKKLHQ
jgi:hypothetical protein